MMEEVPHTSEMVLLSFGRNVTAKKWLHVECLIHPEMGAVL